MPYKDKARDRQFQAEYKASHAVKLKQDGAKYRASHRVQLRESNRRHYAANRLYYHSKQTENHLKRKYGLTIEQYLRMKEGQQGLCALCDRQRALVVDHDHTTGKVRKLLCYGCNMTVGGIETSGGVLFLRRVKSYIRSGK